MPFCIPITNTYLWHPTMELVAPHPCYAGPLILVLACWPLYKWSIRVRKGKENNQVEELKDIKRTNRLEGCWGFFFPNSESDERQELMDAHGSKFLVLLPPKYVTNCRWCPVYGPRDWTLGFVHASHWCLLPSEKQLFRRLLGFSLMSGFLGIFLFCFGDFVWFPT